MKLHLTKILLFPILFLLVVSSAGIEFTIHHCSSNNSTQMFLFQTNPVCSHHSVCQHDDLELNDEAEFHTMHCCHAKKQSHGHCCHNTRKILKIEHEYLPSFVINSFNRILNSPIIQLFTSLMDVSVNIKNYFLDHLLLNHLFKRLSQPLYCCFLI